ncbi:hypothetical protein CR513_44884, partial [Mucuna pruriens]
MRNLETPIERSRGLEIDRCHQHNCRRTRGRIHKLNQEDISKNSQQCALEEVANFVVKKEQLIRFSGERVDIRGYIDLLTMFGDEKAMITISVQYLVVTAKTSYNILIGRPTLNALRAMVSTLHLVMKFPSSIQQIMIVRADQRMAR